MAQTLKVYAAPSALEPDWALVASVAIPMVPESVQSATLPLPEGHLQAIRAEVVDSVNGIRGDQQELAFQVSAGVECPLYYSMCNGQCVLGTCL